MEIKKILSIDDDPFIQTLIQKSIEDQPILLNLVEKVESLEWIKKQIQEFEPDVILLDYMMPYWDGPSLLKYIREFNQKVPIIFITGMDIPEDELVEFKATGLIKKPINPKKLFAQIKGILL